MFRKILDHRFLKKIPENYAIKQEVFPKIFQWWLLEKLFILLSIMGQDPPKYFSKKLFHLKPSEIRRNDPRCQLFKNNFF